MEYWLLFITTLLVVPLPNEIGNRQLTQIFPCAIWWSFGLHHAYLEFEIAAVRNIYKFRCNRSSQFYVTDSDALYNHHKFYEIRITVC